MKSYIVIVLLLLAPPQLTAFDWIAHRANTSSHMENSLAATMAAWDLFSDVVELDVRVSADGIIYLFHDDEIGGTDIRRMAFDDIRALAGASRTPTL